MTALPLLSKEELLVVVEQQAELIGFLQQQVDTLRQEIARLKGGPASPAVQPEPPAWVKPNKAASDAKPRQKRAQAFVRKRMMPTEEKVYTCETCPDCGRTLCGGWEYSRRQVVELPPITPRICDHMVQARYCGVCHKTCVPTPDLSGEVVGGSLFGPQVHALVAYLRQVGRLPLRPIASVLSALCAITVSVGEITRLLDTVATLGKPLYTDLQAQLQQSDYVHGDETGWREDGENGYLWSFSTPTLCYFTYPKTRAQHVVTDVLGNDYKGIVVSDFYAGYNSHLGLHQRCWVHLLRDLHDLTRKYPLDSVLAWAKRLRALYDQAKAFHSDNKKARARARVRCQEALVKLTVPYKDAALPHSTLCKRLLQFESEMFTFVEYPHVPSENNAAERSIRPRVIARKISGGTRSPQGSQTMAILSSLFATWQLRRQECLATCRQMLQDAQQRLVAAPA